MRFLRKVQKGLPDGRGRDRQFEETRERYGVHSVYGVCESLPEEGVIGGGAKINVPEGQRKNRGRPRHTQGYSSRPVRPYAESPDSKPSLYKSVPRLRKRCVK